MQPPPIPSILYIPDFLKTNQLILDMPVSKEVYLSFSRYWHLDLKQCSIEILAAELPEKEHYLIMVKSYSKSGKPLDSYCRKVTEEDSPDLFLDLLIESLIEKYD